MGRVGCPALDTASLGRLESFRQSSLNSPQPPKPSRVILIIDGDCLTLQPPTGLVSAMTLCYHSLACFIDGVPSMEISACAVS